MIFPYKGGAAVKQQDLPECPRVCAYCEHATPLQTEGQMLCPKKGVVEGGFVCRRFRYDPLKRVPTPRPTLIRPDEEDLLL